MLLITLLANSFAATLTVGPNGTYPSLQAAVDASQDGDTLVMEAGVHYGCATLSSRELTIEGAGAQSTFLYGQCADGTIDINGGTLQISDVTLENRAGPSVRSEASNTTLTRVEVFGGMGPEGAVSVVDGHTRIEDSDLSFNDGTRGAAVTARKGTAPDSSLVIVGTRFVENASEQNAGAVWVDRIRTVTVSGSVFERNAAQEDGGAVRVEGSDWIQVADTLFRANIADGDAGGLDVIDVGTVVLVRNTFTGHSAGGAGGSARVQEAGALSITGGLFAEGDSYAEGGALQVVDTDSITIEGTSFRDLYGRGRGGGIYASGGARVDILDTTFANCSSDTCFALSCSKCIFYSSKIKK